MSGIFDPAAVKATLKLVLPEKQWKKSVREWDSTVSSKYEHWKGNRENQAGSDAQLTWAANVVAYVNFLWDTIKIPPNSGKDKTPRDLARAIPMHGPRFIPPTYMYLRTRQYLAEIEPEAAYLKPLHIIHPVYYPELLKCPRCGTTDRVQVKWNSWTSAGHRKVLGLRRNETVLGYQIRCKDCHNIPDENGETHHCLATTNPIFWENWETWAIPRGIPIFFKRCSVTRDLFDLIVELRLTMTSAGLAENIRQLHLLEYQQTVREYLQYFRSRKDTPIRRPHLHAFSAPTDVNCYEDFPITCDKVTDILLEYSEKTRREESSEYIRTLTGICVSIDNTFKVGDKATVSEGRGRKRLNVMKGGLLNMISERNNYLGWQFCLSGSSKNITNLLKGYERRCAVQGRDRGDSAPVPPPEMLSADNCCLIRSAVEVVFGDKVHIVLDVYHCMMRYLITVSYGKKNPHRKQVAYSIIDAILKERSDKAKGKLARYWSKDEQETRLQEMYEHWSRIGGVWTAASPKVHADQLAHVKKGCLARTREDIASDGSRIEGRHKGWNSLMRANPSGIVVFVALGHDHVHRCNIRVDFSSPSPSPFIQSTYGSHHTRLVNDTALLWNTLRKRPEVPNRNALQPRPLLPYVDSRETFGLVPSDIPEVEDELLELKPEDSEDPDAENDPDLVDVALASLADPTALIERDPTLDPHLLTIAHTPAPLNGDNRDSQASKGKARESDVIDLTDQDVTTSTPDAADAARPCRSTGGSHSTKRKHSSALADDRDAVGERTQKSQKNTGGAVSTQPYHSSAPSSLAEEPTLEPAYTAPSLRPPGLKAPALTGKTVAATTALAPIFQSHAPATTPRDEPAVVSTTVTAVHTAPPTSMPDRSLSAVLPLPPVPPVSSLHGLSRSARFLKQCTSIDIKALKIERSGVEFFEFMDLRLEQQWVVSSMTPRRWVEATEAYNQRLKSKLPGPPDSFVPKSVRALYERLKEIELEVVRRIGANDYKAKKINGTDTFWRKHCHGVKIVKDEPDVDMKLNMDGKPRQEQVCSRCAMLKYPGGKRSPDNHRAMHCADGVRIKAPKEFPEKLPPFPQPQGIFSGGSHMHVEVFLRKMREIYAKAVLLDEPASSFTLEEAAFIDLVGERLEEHPEGVSFKLFKHLTLSPPSSEHIITRGDEKYLLIHCLTAASVPAPLATTPSTEQGPTAAGASMSVPGTEPGADGPSTSTWTEHHATPGAASTSTTPNTAGLSIWTVQTAAHAASALPSTVEAAAGATSASTSIEHGATGAATMSGTHGAMAAPSTSTEHAAPGTASTSTAHTTIATNAAPSTS